MSLSRFLPKILNQRSLHPTIGIVAFSVLLLPSNLVFSNGSHKQDIYLRDGGEKGTVLTKKLQNRTKKESQCVFPKMNEQICIPYKKLSNVPKYQGSYFQFGFGRTFFSCEMDSISHNLKRFNLKAPPQICLSLELAKLSLAADMFSHRKTKCFRHA